nr:MAG TPA: hypothetical protein [Caudoviricetes sp.]
MRGRPRARLNYTRSSLFFLCLFLSLHSPFRYFLHLLFLFCLIFHSFHFSFDIPLIYLYCYFLASFILSSPTYFFLLSFCNYIL